MIKRFEEALAKATHMPSEHMKRCSTSSLIIRDWSMGGTKGPRITVLYTK